MATVEAKKILVVEDETIVAWDIQNILESFGYIVSAVVDSGQDAIQKAAETNPDLVLMDIRLQGEMDGVEAAEQIRLRFNIPIVYVTAHADSKTLQRAKITEPFGYIVKPFQEKELNATIEMALYKFKIEKSLQDEKQWFSTILKSIGDAVVVTNDQGFVTFMNPRAEALTGWTQEDAYGKNADEVLYIRNVQTRDVNQSQTPIRRVIQDGIVVRLADQWILRDKNGGEKPIGDSAAPIKDEQGNVTGVVAIFQDITERKRAEEALRQQAERERLIGLIAQRIRQSLNLEAILNTTVAEVRQFLQADRVLIYRFGQDWSRMVAIESVDPGWTSILGATITDPALRETYIELYQQGQVRAIADVYTAGLDQRWLDLLVRFQVRASLIVPILHEEQLWGLLVAHQCSESRQWQQLEIDLLKQLTTQVAIAIQQSFLFEQVQQLNSTLDRQVQERTAELQQALEFEATLKRITDKVRDSLDEGQILQSVVQELALGMGVSGCDTALYDEGLTTSTIRYEYTISVPASQGRVLKTVDFPEIYRQLLQGQYFQFCEIIPNLLPDQLAMLACPIVDDHGVLGDLWLFKPQDAAFSELEIRLVQQVANQCAIAIRQARLYQAAQTQVQELEKLNQLKDDFLNTVSHELRTPMSSIKMAIQMLEITLNQITQLLDQEQTAKIARYLKIMQDESKREIGLINNLLSLQRLDAGTQPLELETIHLQDWISQVVKPFQVQAQRQLQILQVDIPPQLPPLTCDRSSLELVLTELLNNACKYTPTGEEIKVTARLVPDKLQLQVINSGVEIPTTELTSIFEKFYRIPNADPWKQGGTGLGLALVQKLVAHLGGTIQVESTHHQTCFTVELPIGLGIETVNLE